MDPSTVQQEMSNLQITDTVNEQPRTHLRSGRLLPYDRLFPFLFPLIDQDKVDEILALFEKYKRDEIPKASFFPLMTDIAGEQLLYSATMQMIEKLKENTNREVPTPFFEKFRIQIDSSDLELPFDQLYPFLLPDILNPYKALALKFLFHKYKSCEIPKDTFVPAMTGILGEQLFKSAAAKVKQPVVTNINRRLPVNEQFKTQIDSSDLELPFDQLYPFWLPHILDPDKVIALKYLFDRYRSCEMPKDTFVPAMTGILGEQIFKSAAAKVKQQKSNLQVNEQPGTPQVNEQPGTQINSSNPRVTFYQLFHLLIPQVGIEQQIDLCSLSEKFQRGEIPKSDLVPLMKGIVGKPAFKLAVDLLLRQIRTNIGSSGTSL